MPRKAGRGRGRNITSSPTVSVTGSTSNRRGTGSSNGSSSSNTKGSTQILPKQAGRTTKNSTGNRGRKITGHRRPPMSKPSNGRGRKGRKDTALQDPAYFKADDGVIYRPGDYAYVDSQQPELPFHICVIKDFKLVRKDSVIAEVKWFYRVTELPEAVYLLLMGDRKRGENAGIFDHPKVKDRELFMAFNKDTHPASLFKGKCYIKELHELGDKLNDFLDTDDSFFYAYGYKPESRRLTLENEESFVPGSQQATLPECLCPDYEDSTVNKGSDFKSPQKNVTSHEQLVWDPQLSDDELLMYLRAARSIALHAGVCMTGMLADGYLAASSDETTQHAFDILHKNNNNTENALQDLIKHPIVSRLVNKKNWTKENAVLFSKGMRQFGKNFFKIKTELLPGKEITELVEYYYYWKKTSTGLTSRSTRRQRKTTHIRMSRSLLKPREETPDKEFVDWSSCEEEDGESSEDGEKTKSKSYYACRHCFTVDGGSWHHAGPDKAILCEECRTYFKNYGLMKSLTVKREPPEFMFKDYHESLAQREESSTPPITGPSSISSTPNKKRKTRNSNGTRGVVRPGLRSAKTPYTVKTESDDDEEAEVSESSESSEYDAPVPVSKAKPLQARRSILDNLDENLVKEDIEPPPAKRQKREHQLTEGSLSEEDGSLDSNGDRESSHKSLEGDHSPSHTSTSSAIDDEGGSPSSSSQASPDHAPLPQHFSRVVKDRDSSCARTDLVYLYVPPNEKTVGNKVVSAFPGTGSSAHGGHPSDLPTPTANVKVPIITPHAPQLPMGPPAFMGYPQVPFPAGTPMSAGHPSQAGPSTAAHPEIVKRSNSVENATNREREHQQQQQQQQLLLQQQQQQWLASMQSQIPPGTAGAPHLHPSHPHQTPVTGFPAGAPPNHHDQAQQPMVFTFPTQEEMSIRQRLAATGQIPGTPEHYHLAAMLQQGGYPAAMMASQMENLQRLHEEQQQHAGVATPQPQFVVSGGNITMEQLMLLQQQQAALAAAGLSPVDNPLLEFQRQLEAAMQQVQKDPSLLSHPQVQLLLQQRQLMTQQSQSLQMAGQDPHQINLILQQSLLRMQQEQLLIHQAHQQEAQKQQFMLVRPPGHSETVPNRTRPGVIVGTK